MTSPTGWTSLPAAPSLPLVQLDDVSVALRLGDSVHTALQHVSLTVRRGEWLAVVGVNGSGKSTLGRVVAGLCPVSRGQVQRRAQVGTVFQNPQAQSVGETIGEDLAFGRTPPPQRATVVQALQSVRLDRSPEHRVRTLSGGQRQQLAIAGCLLSGAQLLVLDEPTSMIDPAGRGRVRELVATLCQSGIGSVWITQDMEEAALADRILALADGSAYFLGSPRDFFYPPQVPIATGERTTAASAPAAQLRSAASDLLGLDAPWPVQVMRALARQGARMTDRPLTDEEFAAAWVAANRC